MTLASIFELPASQVVAGSTRQRADLELAVAGFTFIAEVLGSAEAGRVAVGLERLTRATGGARRKTIPLIVVPFMGDVGRRVCEAAKVSWLDLSGNAHIVAPGLRIHIEGRPNAFRGPGRPSSLFAPKSARVARWLLMHPTRAFTQREIARATDMSEGFVSRIVAGLEADGYLERVGVDGQGDGLGGGFGYGSGAGAGHGDGTGGGEGAPRGGREPVRVRNQTLLLDTWRAAYAFDKHTIIRGHVAARSGEALARLVSDALVAEKVEHAATGLAAAWQLTHFAAFRVATFFIKSDPSRTLTSRLGLRVDAAGANLWLVLPNDVGVLQGAEDRQGIRCVHPVQAFVDLKGHAERAVEAADQLRAEFLTGSRDG